MFSLKELQGLSSSVQPLRGSERAFGIAAEFVRREKHMNAVAEKRSDGHSSLYNKRLPKFEAPRSYEEYAQSDSRMTSVDTKPQTVVSTEGELDLEAQVDDVLRCIAAQNSLREILYKMIVFCEEQRFYGELESFILASDEYVHSHILQSPDALMTMLVRHHGLTKDPVDADGNRIDADVLASLGEDAADDLVATYQFAATEAGKTATNLISPEARLNALLAQDPRRVDTFFAILGFCAQHTRTFPEIKDYYQSHDEFSKETAVDSQQLAADFYVDKLEHAGMLVWKGHWEVTEAGRLALAARGA